MDEAGRRHSGDAPDPALRGRHTVELRRLDRLAAEAERGRRLKEAVSLLERAQALDPADPLVALNLGRALKAAGKPSEALGPLSQAAADPRTAADALVLRGLVFHEAGRPGEARADFRRALEADPSCADAWNDLGVLDFQAGEYAAAAGDFRSALDRDPYLADAWFNLADALDELGDEQGSARAREEWRSLGGR